MTARWERVTSLFGAARALDAGARDAFLRAACAGDDALRAEVEALLAADARDDRFLEDPPWSTLAPPPRECLTDGQVLAGRYRVERELAAGGQALVYLAEDLPLARTVVLKVMRAETRWSRWLASRFEQEMRALARIDHPGVVGILDVGTLDDGSPFLVIQHVPGVSLREALAGGPLPPARAAGLLRQMGSALRAAHAAGVAHRDLKPENVMLQPRDGGEAVRLIDFGIAKVERPDAEPHTTTVMVAGTVRYMAPEQFEGRHSAASDVYALALVACEMLGGHPHVRALPRATARATRDALESALAFRPEERPADVEAWSERLAATLVRRRARTYRIATGVAAAALVVTGAAATERWVLLDSAEPVRIVEKVGAFDPLSEGFQAHNEITGTVVDNAARTGYDAWRFFTPRQGYYFHPLTRAQKRRALERGWRLTAEARGDEGAATIGVDFTGVGPRFVIGVLQDGDHETVRLMTQLVPDWRGLEYAQSRPHGYHVYELVYDPHLKSADLWIDGERRLAGYRGNDQFLEDRGLLFGGTVYRSQRGSGAFRSVRFEINP